MQKQRIAWLDYARAFAIICVIVIHSLEMVYKMEFDELIQIGNLSLLFRDILTTVGRMGVPIFLVLTGFLHLDRDFSTGDKIIKFYKRNLLPLWLTTEIWILIYFFIDPNIKFDIAVLLRDMLFIKTYYMGHMWYMPMIIGMYIALPFVSNAVKNISSKVLCIPFGTAMFLFFGFSLYGVLKNIFGWEMVLERKVDASFLGGTYGAYIIFGLFCKRGDLKKIKTPVVWLISALGFAFTVMMLWFSNQSGYDYHLWYDFPGVFIASMFAFEGMSRINLKGKIAKIINPFLTQVSIVSLGIFFIHKPILNLINYKIICWGFSSELTELLLVVIVFILSFLLSFILSKIPVVKKLLLFIK